MSKNDKATCDGCFDCISTQDDGRKKNAHVVCYHGGRMHLKKNAGCPCYQPTSAVRRNGTLAVNQGRRAVLECIAEKRRECGVGMSRDCKRCFMRDVCETFAAYCEIKNGIEAAFAVRGKTK